MAEVPLYVTERGRDLLHADRTAVREKIREIQSQKGEAAESGGNQWHDNFSFEHLVEQERVQQAELERLNREFERLQLIGPPKDEKILRIGHTATLEMEDGSVRQIAIVGYREADMKANPPKVVYLAPIIAPFMEHEVGTELEVELPGGKQTVYLAKIERNREM